MDLDGTSHVRESGVFAGATRLTSFPTVVLAIDQVVTSTEGDEVSVVGRSGNRDRASAADVGVAHLVSELLQLIGAEVVVVPQNMVVRWTRSSLNTSVTAQVEVELGWMCDSDIDSGAGRNVEGFPDLILLVDSEETSVVTFLNSDEGDSWLVTTFEHHTSLSDGSEFALENVQELAFTDTITVEDDSSGLEASVAVELDEQFTDHVGKIGNDLVAVLLDSDSSGISGRMGIHGPDDGSDRWFAGIPGRRVCDVSSQEDDGLTEDSWTYVGQ